MAEPRYPHIERNQALLADKVSWLNILVGFRGFIMLSAALCVCGGDSVPGIILMTTLFVLIFCRTFLHRGIFAFRVVVLHAHISIVAYIELPKCVLASWTPCDEKQRRFASPPETRWHRGAAHTAN